MKDAAPRDDQSVDQGDASGSDNAESVSKASETSSNTSGDAAQS